MTISSTPILATIASIGLLLAGMPSAALAADPPLVNVLLGKTPSTNATLLHGDGDSTAPQVAILNPQAATDGDTSFLAEDANVTKILAGRENGNPAQLNGFNDWQDVYLQYDLGEARDISKIRLFHNGYPAASSTFKNVKVELSDTPEFTSPTVLFDTGDYKETRQTQYAAQIVEPDHAPVSARYLRVWQKGHFIENFNGAWSGYSNGVGFREIEVLAAAKEGEELPKVDEPRNLALGKTPYVYGLEASNIAAISDGKLDGEPAVHNSLGEQWLQFEYRNSYKLSKITLALEAGDYRTITVDVRSAASASSGRVVYSANNAHVEQSPIVIDLDGKGISGRAVRFTVNKDANSPAKYREVEIWGTGASYDEAVPEYVPPASKYSELVWNDEFDGPSVDESKWNIIDGMANHGAIYNRGAVKIQKQGAESYLAIESRNYGATTDLLKAVKWDQYGDETLGRNVTWSSGRVETKNKFSFENGRMAVRAKPNDSQGIWPAIWMLAQDETGHDEIDVLEYLGQEPWNAWTTNHYGILGLNKGSDGRSSVSPVAWSQDFHVFEVEWSPQRITWYIDGTRVHSTTAGGHLDGMHSRPMFPILETQVNGGWVGNVDPSGQRTKQSSNFLIDWVRVYQTKDADSVRFDDLAESGPSQGYAIRPSSTTKGLVAVSDGNAPHEDKDNFFYGGQPRYETNRLAVAEGAKGEQSLVYEVPGVRDVHLTAYHRTRENANDTLKGMPHGHSIREGANGRYDFTVLSSVDAKTWELQTVKTVDNFVEPHPAFARTTYDVRNLPEDTRFVKIVFPSVPGADGAKEAATSLGAKDVQLAKVTMRQRRAAQTEPAPEEPGVPAPEKPDVPAPDPAPKPEDPSDPKPEEPGVPLPDPAPSPEKPDTPSPDPAPKPEPAPKPKDPAQPAPEPAPKPKDPATPPPGGEEKPPAPHKPSVPDAHPEKRPEQNNDKQSGTQNEKKPAQPVPSDAQVIKPAPTHARSSSRSLARTGASIAGVSMGALLLVSVGVALRRRRS